MDHMEQKRIQLNQIEMFVLDEADRMLDMGFIKPVVEIASKMPSSKQTLMFSATFDKNVRKLSLTLLKDPFEITTETTPANQARIQQEFIRTDDIVEKQRRLEELLRQPDLDQAIVFSSTKIQSEKIARKLRDAGLAAGALHGDMHQRQRTRTLEALRCGKIRILVATDVAGRGIDVLTITHVINFDLPRNVEDYVHRIGRTGRAGNTGIACSFYSHRDMQVKREIEKKFGMKTSSEPAPAPQKKHKKKQFWKQKRSFPRSFRRH
jgi:superfamily II DNA/RNA helicase